MQHDISIDLETRSSADISKTGSYKYLQDEDFEILLLGYKIDDQPVVVLDLTDLGGVIPAEITSILLDPNYTKHAYNAAFEWYAFQQAGIPTPIEQWQCTMVWALYEGYAAGLASTGEAIGLPEDKKKLMTGKALIRYFCTPNKRGGKKYHTKTDDPAKWELFKKYNARDVESEYAILKRLKAFPVPDREWRLWRQDIRMNAFGVRIDRTLVDNALLMGEQTRDALTREAAQITKLDNPNSTAQLKHWLSDHGLDLPDLRKTTVADTLEQDDLPPDARRVLRIRQLVGKTSVKKYDAMKAAIGEDGRVRGISQYYGANRSGRYAGRLLQLQNLPRNSISTLENAREMVKRGNYEGIQMIYGDVLDTLSQLIRTALIPSEGNHFAVSDFSAIEARLLAWMADEKWVMDVFAKGGDIYCATASQMFGVPVEKHGINGELRQKGKIATLALGYGGSVGAMVSMGALKMGIPEEDLPQIVSMWRNTHPNTVQMWQEIGDIAIRCYNSGRDQILLIAGGRSRATFRMEGTTDGRKALTVELPAGRKLFYQDPFITKDKWGRDSLGYYGTNQQTKKWSMIETFGGKLTENLVQAIARDCLCEVLLRVEDHGWQPVFHVHDEIILDAPMDVSADDLNALMAEPIPWAPGLLLKGAGFESFYYMKD